MAGPAPRNITAVGGLVVRDESLLVVRLTYGATRGRLTLPGGVVDPGETLDVAVVREVREETGIEARALGIVGLRSRVDGQNNDTYVLWLCEPIGGHLRPDGREVEHCEYLECAEIEQRDDATDMVRYLARRLRAGNLSTARHVNDYASEFPTRDPEAWKLFL